MVSYISSSFLNWDVFVDYKYVDEPIEQNTCSLAKLVKLVWTDYIHKNSFKGYTYTHVQSYREWVIEKIE